jgi:hypothetical protein
MTTACDRIISLDLNFETISKNGVPKTFSSSKQNQRLSFMSSN